MTDDASLNERVFDALMAAGKRSLADEYAAANGGDVERPRQCEDYPCCGHERGDCNGELYGSDEQIKADVERAFRDPDYAWRMERQAEYNESWY